MASETLHFTPISAGRLNADSPLALGEVPWGLKSGPHLHASANLASPLPTTVHLRTLEGSSTIPDFVSADEMHETEYSVVVGLASTAELLRVVLILNF